MMSLKQVVEQLKKISYVETIIQFGSSLEREDFKDIDICLITTRTLSMKEEMYIRKEVPDKYDLSFYDDLPLHLKKQVLTAGKVLYTKDDYHLLKIIQYVDAEYPRYKTFLEEYHQEMIAAI